MEDNSAWMFFLICVVPLLSQALDLDDPHTHLAVVGGIVNGTWDATVTEVVCDDGWTYIKADDKCVPVHPTCDLPCINAKCTDTNVCTCNSGLKRHNATLCVPPCREDQINDLSKPGSPCMYMCSQPCTNGYCVGIEQCSCKPVYQLINQYTCEHKCTRCEHGTCEAPDFICKCLAGYNKNDGKCEPGCDEECLNGHCTAPNYCTCESLYSKDKTNKFKCNPVCKNDCVNSTCVAPNICKCNKGFERVDDGSCRPICKSCDNGVCQSPGVCECNTGYAKDDKDIRVCIPVCKSCDHGVCVAPENCTCNSGYDKNDKGICVPTCKSCDDGVCQSPDVCECNTGYEKNDKGVCTPTCISCTHGVCTKPNTCVCNVGYKMDELLKICRPDCNPSCVNGTCVAVNVCRCIFGHEKTNVSNVCKPACVSCSNGDCVEPGVCRCHENYELVNGTCLQPFTATTNCLDCASVCKDGVCTCVDGSLCHQIDAETVVSLAGWKLTWVCGAVVILGGAVAMAVLIRFLRHRQTYQLENP